jgi:parallel beta-helix repeat protein
MLGCAFGRGRRGYVRVRLLISIAVGLVLVATPAAASPTSRTNFVDVKRNYGTTDSDIRRAILTARSSGRALYFAPGRYTYHSNLVLDGLTAYGDGSASILSADNPSRSAVVLRGARPVLRDIQISSPRAATRSQAGAAAGIQVDHATGFVVQRVTVAGAENVGIIVFGGIGGRVVDNTVSGTLADGIHLTDGSRRIVISGNTVHDVGDDMIAVVSYLTQRVPCAEIVIANNNVYRQTSGRGITAVGGQNITIRRNAISGTYGAGVLVASDGSYGTYGTLGVKVLDNVVDTTDVGQIGHAGIQLFGQPGQSVQGTVVSGNVVKNTRSRGIYVGPYTQTTTVSGNTLTNIAGRGVYLDRTQDTTVTMNTLSQVDNGGIYASGSVTGRLIIDSNVLSDVNRVRQAQTYVIQVAPNGGLAYGQVTGNRYSNPSGYPYERLVESTNPRIFVFGNKVVG